MAGRSVLAIGAHPDDIELGCGGTLVKHVAAGDEVTMLIVTTGEVGPGDTVRRVAEQMRSVSVIGAHRLVWGEGIPDCKVSLHELEVVHLIERTIRESRASVIYTHAESDSHQDHRAVAQCTMGAARKVPSVLAYGAPSVIRFAPTTFVDIADTLDKKVEALLCHSSQVAASDMVSESRVRSSAEHYGHACRCMFAEAFESVRYVVEV